MDVVSERIMTRMRIPSAFESSQKSEASVLVYLTTKFARYAVSGYQCSCNSSCLSRCSFNCDEVELCGHKLEIKECQRNAPSEFGVHQGQRPQSEASVMVHLTIKTDTLEVLMSGYFESPSRLFELLSYF